MFPRYELRGVIRTMTDREMVSVRLETDTKNRVEQYAEEHDVTRSTAIRRLLEKGADLEEAGIAVAASQLDKSNQEPEPKADGNGAVVRPFLQTLTAISAFMVFVPFLYALGIVYVGLPEVVPGFDLLAFILSSALLLVLVLLPQYTRLPELVDEQLWTTARTIAPSITEPNHD